MRFYEAFEQAKAGGRKLKQETSTTWFSPESITNLTQEQATANNWVVSSEVSKAITPSMFKQKWNSVRGEFTAVKDADSSALFKRLAEVLFK